MTSSIWTGVSSLISGLLALALEITLLVVALTTVQKRRPDAAALLASAAGVQMAATILTPIAFIAVPRMGSSLGYIESSALVQLGFTVLRSIGGALLIIGIVRLAADARDTSRPY